MVDFKGEVESKLNRNRLFEENEYKFKRKNANMLNRESGNNTVIVEKGITAEEANKYYYNEDYEFYFVEYAGDIIGKLNALDYAKIFNVGLFFAVLFVKKGRLEEVLKAFPEITKIEREFPFTLYNLEESSEAPNLKATEKGEVPLNGDGVIVGIIGTGIDYLSPSFMDEKGNSRILAIWDQSIEEGPIPETFYNGTEYTREDINKAIAASNMGENPYDIVKHKDEVGHGTVIANIVGGRKVGESGVEGIAPKCEFIIVKVREATMENRVYWGLENYKGIVYGSSEGAASLGYINKMHQKYNKPTVMYITLGTNLGTHDGSTVGERFLSHFAEGRLFSIASSTGDQGDSPICAKSSFKTEEFEKVIDIRVDENQENLFFTLDYIVPDKFSFGITSPNGEAIEKIPINPINGDKAVVTLGETTLQVQYFSETKDTGKQVLYFVLRNLVGGIWKLNIKKEEAIFGTVNLWLQQKQFSVGTTGFVDYTPFTTIMTPATANNMIVTASFNEIDNVLMKESGWGFTIDNRVSPTIATAAKNIVTVGLNNKPIVVSGTAVSGAILTGVLALLYQWGIVEKNDVNMYSTKIKSYLIQGAIREQDKLYPNAETGYGVLDMKKLFEKLYKRENRDCNEECKLVLSSRGTSGNNLYVNIPRELYLSLKK